MAEDWVLCMGIPDPDARRAVEDGHGTDLRLVHYEDAPERERADLLATAPAILLWSAKLTAGLLESAKALRIVQRIGEGTDKMDLAAARAAGVLVAKTTGINATSSAELTLLLMLAALRRLPAAHASMVDGRWEKWSVREGTHELRGKRVGIVGLGKIGQLVATRVRAFEATVAYHSRRRLPADAEHGALHLTLDELLTTSDIVTLHVPLGAATAGMIGANELRLMKRGAILVNTARGGLVDEAALAAALAQHDIAAAGLDVFRDEPPAPDHPLRALDNVVLTPHVGGVTDDSRALMVARAFANIRRTLAGEVLDPIDVVVAP